MSAEVSHVTGQGFGPQKWVRIRELYGAAFRGFVEPFRVTFPTSGLTLIDGVNLDTNDSSNSGKSSLVLALSYLFGGCPYPATELQSWHTEETMFVGGVLDTSVGTVKVERRKGLAVTIEGKTTRGKAAEAVLNSLFGMDEKQRAATTYRGQDDKGGLFLSMTDPEKQDFLTVLLGLTPFKRVYVEAGEKLKELQAASQRAAGRAAAAREALERARAAVPAATPTVAAELEKQAAVHETNASALAAEVRSLRAKLVELAKDEETEQDEADSVISAEAMALPADPEELVAARAELETVRTRLGKVRDHDSTRRSELEAQRNALKVKRVTALAYASRLPQAEKAEAAEGAALHAFQAGTCHTCGQTLPADSDLYSEHARLLTYSYEEAQKDVLSCKRAADQVKDLDARLAAIPTFEPHKLMVPLAAAETAAVLKVRELEKTAAAARAEVQRQNNARRVAARNTIAEKFRQQRKSIETTAGSIEDQATHEVQMARELRASAATAKAAEAVRAERLAAVSRAEQDVSEADADLAKAEAEAKLELDVQAVTGRRGFPTAYFDDALQEVAAATNELLARVANVSHITFGFDAEESQRITPFITVGGERRPIRSGISGGMYSALALAVDLGFAEVVAKRRGSFPGWMVLDESFDGLGRVSKRTCMEMLGEVSDRLILAIDHSTEMKSLFTQIVRVESKGGFCKVVS